jgi:hypothetical protein
MSSGVEVGRTEYSWTDIRTEQNNLKAGKFVIGGDWKSGVCFPAGLAV